MIDPLPSDIFRVGEVLNNTYEIEAVLGRGGTGEVYRVVNNVNGRVFAVKALNAQFSKNDDYLELMKREEEMRHINQDSVVSYFECSRTDNGHVILRMDYIAGPSLADAMVERQVSEQELLIIGHRIALGLEAAHGQGIVHRDLSPDNIILRDDAPEKATLIDFGIAKDTAVGARTIVGNEFAGKYEYAAPEQVDGKAEARSDLYALGATLLAAYRGETPFLGTTPGEIVRRKQGRLDTDGVPERLRRLVEKLSDPDLAARPANATATVALIEDILDEKKGCGGNTGRKSGGRGRRGKKPTGNRRRAPIVLASLAALAVLVGGYFLVTSVIWPQKPFVTPFTLTATKGIAGRTMLDGHAPDEDASDDIATAFMAATGAPRDAATLTLADGVPDDSWAADIEALLDLLSGLRTFDLTVSDRDAELSGLAADLRSLQAAQGALQSWQSGSSFSLDQDLLAGPETLSAGAVARALAAVQTCGPLSVEGDDFPLQARVPITGNVGDATDAGAIEEALRSILGSRTPDLYLNILNPDVCAIRNVLPAVGSGDMTIWLGNGRDGSANLAGIYRTGENPIVDVLVPSTQTDAHLWVIVVDNKSEAYHVIPNVHATETQLDRLGTIEGGVRRVPVLHTVSAVEADPKKLGIRVDPDNYGKSEIVAFLTRRPLFEGRRPRSESITSVKEALTEALRRRESNVVGIATRFIDARQ